MNTALPDRRAAVAALLAPRAGTIVITGLGSTTYDVAAVGDDPRNFYLWGAMGGAAMMGLGVALAQPETPVLVVTGDGEMLMGMGAFATIARQAPRNLSVVVIDNELYGETGAQETHTAGGADLAAIAKASGITDAITISDMEGASRLADRVNRIGDAPTVAIVKVARGETGKTLALRDGAHMKGRFRTALGLRPD